MRHLLATGLLWFLSPIIVLTDVWASDTRGRPAPPNIIVFLVDDMGWRDTSVDFTRHRSPVNDHFRTPSMERLAEAGMKFTNAYASSVCSPSRVSFMTGMNAARHRVTDWTLRRDGSQMRRHPSLDQPDWNYRGLGTQPDAPNTLFARTLAELLAGAGYRTIHIGKSHLGALDTPGADPLRLGFHVNVAGHAAGAPGSYYGTHRFAGSLRQGRSFAPDVWDVPDLRQYHDRDINLTEALTLEAIARMDRAVADGKPFFLHMSHYTVHTPIMPDPRFIDHYHHLDQAEAAYASMVEAMDNSLGRLLDRLEHHGIADRTVVLFFSDNGGLSVHSRGGQPNTHNAPLSSGKGSAREGGIRVPMLVRWPGVTPGGSVTYRKVIVEDFFPTLLEIAGISPPDDLPQEIDGVSFVPLLERREAGYPEQRSLFWHYPHWWGPSGPGIDAFSAIRRGPWKLIYYHADRSYELFNLDVDLGETTNLADRNPEEKRDLAAVLARYLRDVGAQMPMDRQTGEPVPLP